MEDWQIEAIKDQEQYIKEAQAEQALIKQLADGLKLISIGLEKIGEAIQASDPFEGRIKRHQERIEEIKRFDKNE